MPTYRVVNKQEKNALSESTWEWSKSQDHEEKKKDTPTSWQPWRDLALSEPRGNFTNLTDAKNKSRWCGRKGRSEPPPPLISVDSRTPRYPSIPTSPHLGRLRGWLADWQATVRISNERPSPCRQSAGHLGRGGFGWGRAAWLQALIPRCYDRASGWEIWRVSPTTERPACSSTRPRLPRWAPLTSLQCLPHSRHFQSASNMCLPASLDPTHPSMGQWQGHR